MGKMLQAQLFTGNDEWKEEMPLYEFILRFLAKQKVFRVTIYQGWLGFDGSHMSRPNDLFSFDETPVVVTFIDTEEKVHDTLVQLRKVVKIGLVVTHHVDIWE